MELVDLLPVAASEEVSAEASLARAAVPRLATSAAAPTTSPATARLRP